MKIYTSKNVKMTCFEIKFGFLGLHPGLCHTRWRCMKLLFFWFIEFLATLVVYENVATPLLCQAPEMFCGLNNFSRLVRRDKWLNINFGVNCFWKQNHSTDFTLVLMPNSLATETTSKKAEVWNFICSKSRQLKEQKQTYSETLMIYRHKS